MNNRPTNIYAGLLTTPSDDFSAVRDGRTAQPFYLDVDLTTARSDSAGTSLLINASGNSFYCDANPVDGSGFVEFQDTSFDAATVPLYVSPGCIFNTPFTQFKITNTAQPGKKIRIAYGVDVDFQPGSVAQLSVTNAGGYTSVRPEAQTGFSNVQGVAVANTAENLFTAGANANGAILLSAEANDYHTAQYIGAFLTKATAPASATDGTCILDMVPSGSRTTDYIYKAQLQKDQYIAAGQGLWFIANATGSTALRRSARWKLL